jgi:hypothetical protein
MPLPDSWVDSLFARLQVRYGSAWTNLWQGIDPAAVKADWAEELAGFESNPAAIKHALDNLPPDRPPMSARFKALCLNRPEPMPKQLPAPKADDAIVKAVVAAVKPSAGSDPKAWAYELRRRDRLGDRLTKAQRDMWRAALGAETAE